VLCARIEGQCRAKSAATAAAATAAATAAAVARWKWEESKSELSEIVERQTAGFTQHVVMT